MFTKWHLLMGGTFDPVHYGHLRAAEEVREALNATQLHFLPCGNPVHGKAPAASPAQRVKMLELAIEANPQLTIDLQEVSSRAPSYTVTSLSRLRQQLGPTRPIGFLVGSDAFEHFLSWKDWRGILRLSNLIVFHRPASTDSAKNASLSPECKVVIDKVRSECPATKRLTPDECETPAPAGNIIIIPATPLAISSTLIRTLLTRGASARYLLPPEVLEYIKGESIYC